MKDYLAQINEPPENNTESSLVDAHNYWLKKRMLFNIIVGAFGLLATIMYATIFTEVDFIGIIMWGIIANALYSFGYVLESYIIIKNAKIKTSSYREYFFWIGTVLYSLVSFLFARNYFANFYGLVS